MNTKTIADKEERKTKKRAARKAAPPKAKRTEPRGSTKKKIVHQSKGQRKR